MPSVAERSVRSAVGGSGPKGEAIAAAALRLFLREGYERTSVDAIAAEAGVSKRTIYNRYGDKESLFLAVLRDTFTRMLATFRAIADAHLGQIAESTAEAEGDLTAFVREAALRLTAAPDRIALIRLILTEAPFFPSLLRDEMGQMSMHGTLSHVLARLAQAGWLDITDPAEAAEHLFALTFSQVSNKTMFSGVRLSDAEVERIVTSGLAVFLRAYRPA